MSVRGYHQAMQEYMNRSPGAELHRVRLENAKRLLASSSARTEDIAAACGFINLNSFWVAFRDATGESPNKYRNKHGLIPLVHRPDLR
jgi:transcriptional regulator GlxA family with amidase domain